MAASCQIPTGGRHRLTNPEQTLSTSCICYFISVSFLWLSLFFSKLNIHWNKRNLCGFSSSRPAVRALPSKHMFEHMMKRHDVLFVYIGGESPLKVSAFISCRTDMNQDLSFILSTCASSEAASMLKMYRRACDRRAAPTLNTKNSFCATPCSDSACTADLLKAFVPMLKEACFLPFHRRSTTMSPPSSLSILTSSRPRRKSCQR